MLLRGVPDVERILARGAEIGTPARSRRPARVHHCACRRCGRADGIDSPRLGELAADFGEHPDTLALLERALVEQPPLLTRDGGMIAAGFDAELDELRALSENADRFSSIWKRRSANAPA